MQLSELSHCPNPIQISTAATAAMSDHHTHRNHRHARRTPPSPPPSCCCSFKILPKSPDPLPISKTLTLNSSPFPPSPRPGIARRILSPGRVSPLTDPPGPDPEAQVDGGSTRLLNRYDIVSGSDGGGGVFDVRLSLKGKNNGGCLILEVNSKVLWENSLVFRGLIEDCRKNLKGLCRIEVGEVENLCAFRDTIELMFEEDVMNRLLKVGACRAIDILEVSESIKFSRGVSSCFKYLEAVPWTEEEEIKLRKLFTKFKFDGAATAETLSRLNFHDSSASFQNLAGQLVRSITGCSNVKARNELKPMIKNLLDSTLVYGKPYLHIKTEELYAISRSCLDSLISIFNKNKPDKPLIESVSWQVDNLIWVFEILLDHHMAEEFVSIWANQNELILIHETASPMVRYELSRVSAALFVALGTRKLQCGTESRVGFVQSWFGSMLVDFGWLQRCRKGLDVRELEEAMGQVLLTLPLKLQHEVFMEWFRCFSKYGRECPNLSKSFQMWWRRSFLRDLETRAVESR